MGKIQKILRPVVEYFREIAPVVSLLLLAFGFLVHDNIEILWFSLFGAFLIIILTFRLVKHRKKEIQRISEVIRRIRQDEFSSPEEIVLNDSLSDLQEEIRGMFMRTKEDLESMKKLAVARKEFLGNVSHELRTPIFSIQGYLETLVDGAIDDKKVNKTFLEKAIRHTENLNSLLNDLIDISMIESGQMKMSFRYNKINSFIAPYVEDFRDMASEKKISLKFEPAEDEIELLFDKNRMRQIIVNLIQNAMKYTEEGEVIISVKPSGSFVTISVRDTGMGIAPADLPRIFERFYRVDKNRSRTIGGTGLGLAIVKHIVEAHGSEIKVTSTLGKGSEFYFNLKR
jgi:two-component system phosphate regulon sensor histidine kinase PhoR